jgi:hypothetical protein
MQVPRALVVVLALGTLLAAFLLGRQCSQGRTSGQAALPSTLVARAPASPAERPYEPAPSITTPTSPAAAPPVTAPATLLPATSPTPVNARENGEVARYFQESEAIQARAKYWTDPQALARTILEQTGGGNPCAFDELIRTQTVARTEMQRMSVPPDCAEHHRRSIAVMSEGLALLERVKNALTSGELGGLDNLQEKAREVEREAREIDELGKEIRQRYGMLL